jgi:hypothetical protein
MGRIERKGPWWEGSTKEEKGHGWEDERRMVMDGKNEKGRRGMDGKMREEWAWGEE